MPEISLEVEITLTLDVEYTYVKGYEATHENPGCGPQIEDLRVFWPCHRDGAWEDITEYLTESQREKLIEQILEHERNERYA